MSGEKTSGFQPASAVTHENRENVESQKFYFCTAIHYLNGNPHLGHCYEMILADVVCRYHRVAGRNVFFLTGTDEHGQKVAGAAEKNKMTPQQHCDIYAAKFRDMDEKFLVKFDKFIRTTDEDHKQGAQWAWNKAVANGDVYFGKYVGWYNVREETFVTQRDAEAANFKDVDSGAPLQQNEEECYFFRLSNYKDKLIELLSKTDFCYPAIRKSEVLSRLERNPLEDLCISRKTLKWGVNVPDYPGREVGSEGQVMYVWFDALSNYLTGVGVHHSDEKGNQKSSLSAYWPPDEQMIGKDIGWFHYVIWPAMLMSMGLELPRRIGGHGFVMASDGMKMSKSIGNVMDPLDLIKSFSPETLRYYLIAESRYGADARFGIAAMIDAHNASLCDVYGNLVHRAIALCVKNCGGVVPDLVCDERPVDFNKLFDKCEHVMLGQPGEMLLNELLEDTMNATKDINKYLTTTAPWAIKDDDKRKKTIIRTVLESLFIVTHFLLPVLPSSAEEVARRLGTPLTTLSRLSANYDNLKPGTPTVAGEVLYKKLVMPEVSE